MNSRTLAVTASCFAGAVAYGCGSSGGLSGADSGPSESGSAASYDVRSSPGEDAMADQTTPVPDDGGASDATAPREASEMADSGLPPIDPTLAMAGLDDAQLGEICDWMYSLLGGYGQVVQCPPNGTMTNEADRAACVADHSYSSAGCDLTVEQFETCIQAEAPTKACDTPEPQCTPVFYCRVHRDN
jgi:hypothetical protein